MVVLAMKMNSITTHVTMSNGVDRNICVIANNYVSYILTRTISSFQHFTFIHVRPYVDERDTNVYAFVQSFSITLPKSSARARTHTLTLALAHTHTQASALGLMMMPGICCCDAWQTWSHWSNHTYEVAMESLTSQVQHRANVNRQINMNK